MIRSVYSLLVVLCLTLGSSCIAFSKETLKVYTYHNKPPYFDSQHPQKAGIYQNLLDQLNSNQQQFQLELRYLPRKRLNYALEKNKLDGIIIGVNPIWFQDTKREKYLWSVPFMSDRDIFVTSGKLEKNSAPDFSGLRFSLTRGNYYKGISEEVNAGRIELIESQSALQSIQMLSHERADISILSQATADYYQVEKLGLDILKEPHARFERHILFPKNFQHALKVIDPLLKP